MAWLILLLRGDWGRSILSNRPVLADILPSACEYRTPHLVHVGVLIIAFPAGIIAAVWPNSWKDYSAMMVAMAGVSIPEFFLGVLLFLIFALTLRWFPVAGHINFWTIRLRISAICCYQLLPWGCPGPRS